MYEQFKLCPNLEAGEKCFRVLEYRRGEISEVFHEHVPANRISLDSAMEALRALVSQFGGWSGRFTLHSRLNNRRGRPEKYPEFTSHVTYPEAGAIRRYVDFSNISSWVDEVVNSETFRAESE